MRAGFGTVRADAQFARNQAECRARGIPAIFYWFNYPSFNSPQAEAALFNAVVGPLQAGEAMMGDFEDDLPASTFPRGQAGVDWARAFLTALQTPQNASWWYTYPALFYAVGFDPLLGTWPFVLADYRTTPDPRLEAAAIALQFTDCGATPGVTGCCDQNRVLMPPLSQWEVPVTQDEFNALLKGNIDFQALIGRVLALIDNTPMVTYGPTAGEVNQLKVELDQLRAGTTDPNAVASAVVALEAKKLAAP